jgi:hypothetical protein
MALSSCPICRARLQRDATHCSRCGIRVAALDRRPKHGDAEAAPRSQVSPWRGGLLWGLRLLAADIVVATAWAIARGGFLGALDTAAVVSGGLALCLSVALGGVRIFRWGEYEDLRRYVRGEARAERANVRFGLAIGGASCLLVALALAITGH